ncbi:hypothetical protein ACS0TY_021559 [Phlomoides rotata]
MEEESNRSSGAFQVESHENSKPSNEGEVENRGEKVGRDYDERRVSSYSYSDCAVRNSSRGDSRASKSETLASVKLSDGDFPADFDESSHHLSEVPVEYSLQSLQSAEDVKDQVKTEHESLKGITGQSAEVQVQHQIQVPPDGPSSKLELLPTPATKPISAIASSNPREQKLQPLECGNYACLTEQEKKNSPDPKHLSIAPVPRTPSDGYNWRKYGQKQVKSPEGSRSYYRCTFSDCCAKKIECSDRSNRLIETVYRSHHTHDPPQKVNCSRENKSALAIAPVNGSNNSILRRGNDPAPSTPSKDLLLGLDEVPETKQESSGSDETTETNMKEQYADGPECKKRQQRNSTAGVESLSKPGKKPKYVVHAAGEVGISGDGYRWRKYGQKMVKGNPHPRNYYRCTSAGCPVRKHIETAVDNSSAVVITYKGVHDHDTPVPRKCHAPKTGIAVTSSPIPSNDLQDKTKQHNKSQTQWSVDKEGELTGEAMVGGEKASESTKTLLSVGFEIKPC